MDSRPPCSPVHRIFQAGILEWVAIPFSRGSSRARDQTQVSRTAGGFFTIWAAMETPKVINDTFKCALKKNHSGCCDNMVHSPQPSILRATSTVQSSNAEIVISGHNFLFSQCYSRHLRAPVLLSHGDLQWLSHPAGSTLARPLSFTLLPF